MKASLALGTVLCSALIFLSSCSQEPRTRGIGVYPGESEAYDGPVSVPGGNDYRNLALGRAAWHSSCVDYNLTGHLLTDGVISSETPLTLEVFTNGQRVEKRLREKILDDNFTNLTFPGGKDAGLVIRFSKAVSAENISFEGLARAERGKTPSFTPKMCVTLLDGKKMELPLSPFVPTTMAGGGSQNVSVLAGLKASASNTSAQAGDPRMRGLFSYIASVPEDARNFTSVEISLGSESVRGWTISEVNFYEDGREVPRIGSEHFVSAWVPEGENGGSVTVDLGDKASFDKFKVFFAGEESSSGTIESSPDSKTWTKVASFKAGESEIPAKGSGRYVRLTVDNSVPVSEFEVWGKGGVKAQAQSPRLPEGESLSISRGCWTIQRASEVKDDGEAISAEGYSTDTWLPATVPGTVAGSFFNAGAIPDIRYDDDQLQISESFFNSDFWYRGSFTLPPSFKGRTLTLDFGGVNWKADVFLNGESLGRIEGAFRRESFDVTDKVKESNTIAVLIHRNDHPGTIKEQTEQTPDNNGGILGADNPTFHPTIGWDWIPTVRGRAIGIWDDVTLRASDGVKISDGMVGTHLLDGGKAELTPRFFIRNITSSPQSGKFTVKVGETEFSTDVTLSAKEEKEVILAPKTASEPLLWWPNGYGEQNLTWVEALFTSTDGKVSAKTSFKTGLREMTYTTCDGILDVYVNGRRLIGNGGNWGFPEINLNYRSREYDAAVAYHADMNFTMIRNWVGQTPDEEFYEACDKYGVMIWQDFWLANPWDGPDPDSNSLFMDNALDYVRKIRNHASIAFYCGRNEGNPPAELDAALRDLVAKEHPGMFYIPHSAEGPVSGYGPYSALPVKTYFDAERGRDRLHSERGMPNVMTERSMRRMLREENLWPQNSLWGLHDLTLEGAQRASTFNGILERKFGKPVSLSEYTTLAQWVNYEGYRAMYESRSWNRKGLVIWMSHSSWPSLVWQTYDYYFCPTGGYFGAKKGSAPLRIQWNPVLEKAEAVNDNFGDLEGAKAILQVLDSKGGEVFRREDNLDIKDDSTLPLAKMDVDSTLLGKVYYHKFRIEKDGKVLADNFYVQSRDGGSLEELKALPKAKVTLSVKTRKSGESWILTASLKNTASTPALMLTLDLLTSDGDEVLPVIYEDNYFSLMPGEEKTVRITCKVEDTRGGKPYLEMTGFNL